MAIVRWDPFSALVSPEDLFRQFRRPLASAETEGMTAWAPAVDIYEREGEIVVEAELPGLDSKDIDVSVEEGMLTIKGQRKAEREVKEENYYRVERSSGYFRRSMRLPAEADEEKVNASYDNGVLTVTVPKEEPKKPKSIPVKGTKKAEKTEKSGKK
jgi:HSP20 family protein